MLIVNGSRWTAVLRINDGSRGCPTAMDADVKVVVVVVVATHFDLMRTNEAWAWFRPRDLARRVIGGVL